MARLTRTPAQGKRGVLLFGVLLGFGLAMVFNRLVSAYGGSTGSPVPVVSAAQSSTAAQSSKPQLQPAKDEAKQEQQKQQPELKEPGEKPPCAFPLSRAADGGAPVLLPTPGRGTIFKILQQEGLKTGAELGVQVRACAAELLLPGPCCQVPAAGTRSLPPTHLWQGRRACTAALDQPRLAFAPPQRQHPLCSCGSIRRKA